MILYNAIHHIHYIIIYYGALSIANKRDALKPLSTPRLLNILFNPFKCLDLLLLLTITCIYCWILTSKVLEIILKNITRDVAFIYSFTVKTLSHIIAD